MMTEKEFLQIFFTNDNEFCLEKINCENDNQNQLRPLVNRLLNKKETVLPLRFKGKIYWYGITTTDEQFNRLGEELRTFIGRTYSNFLPLRPSVVNHPIDKAVDEYTNGRYFRFTGYNKIIFKKIEYLRRMWEIRPSIDKQMSTSVGRLLRNFFLTISMGPAYRHRAEKLIEELKNRKFLNAVNILFLQIQMLSEYEEWDEILSLKSLSDVINMRRPHAVTESLFKAIYNNKLKSKEKNPEELLDTFLNVVVPEYGTLIATRGNFKESEALILLMLNAVVVLKDITVVNGLLEVSNNGSTTKLLIEISNKLIKHSNETKKEYSENINSVQVSILKGNFDYALGILKNLRISWETTMMLFQCAYQLQSLEARELALNAYRQLPLEEQEKFLLIRQNKEYLDEITEGNSSSEVRIPNNWLSWFESLEYYTPMKNFYHASEGSIEWSIEELLDPGYSIEEFIEQLYACYDDEQKKESLYISFPHILRFFQKDGEWPRREFKSIYITLLEMLSLNEEKGESELTIFQYLLEAILQIGIRNQEYNEILGMWKETWFEIGSYKYLEDGISVFETFLEYPCPIPEVLLEVFLNFSNTIHVFVRKLTNNELKVLKHLFSDFKQEEAWLAIEAQHLHEENVSGGKDFWGSLSGKTIGIYTLMESVSIRVKNIIKSNNKEINVIINNDKSGSELLKNLVKTSDILLVATSSAKHAATIFIEQHLNESTLYLRPTGKGSSSMLNILEEHREYFKGSS
jgi:hypothetical protein